MRDLTRARGAAVEDLRLKRQQVSSFLLRLGRHYPGKKSWSKPHMNWLASQKLDHVEQRIAFEEMLLAVRQAQDRIARLEEAIRVGGAGLVARRDGHGADGGARLRSRFGDRIPGGDRRSLALSPSARVDGYLGFVPSEDSTGDAVKRGRITKAGNRRARCILVECSWSYRHPPRIGKESRQRSQPRQAPLVRSPGKRSAACSARFEH